MSGAACAKILLCGTPRRSAFSVAEALAQLAQDGAVKVPDDVFVKLNMVMDKAAAIVNDLTKPYIP